MLNKLLTLIILLSVGCGSKSKEDKSIQPILPNTSSDEEVVASQNTERELSNIQLKEKYPWEGGDNFDLHFNELKEGWTIIELIKHSGIPKEYQNIKQFNEEYNASIKAREKKFVLEYEIQAPPQGGFYHNCTVTITDGKISNIKIDSRHISIVPNK